MKIINSLPFRIITPVILIVLLIGLGLYLFVLRSVSGFADIHIKDNFLNMSHDVYNICDRSLSELLRTGLAGDEKAVRIKKGLAIGEIENFLRQNNIEGYIIENGKEVLYTGDLPPQFLEMMEKNLEENVVSSIEYAGGKYYTYHIHFEPWKWHIILTKDASAYSQLVQKVNVAYGATAFILLINALLVLFYLHRSIRMPIDRIITSLKKGEKPGYKGIYEFEFLSNNVSQIMMSLQEEIKMLNNIYHIAASRRGEEFFDEVTMAIGRLFDLNSFIARINPDGETAYVVSLHLNGEIKKGINIFLKDTPCEDITSRKHMCVIERNAYKQFPEVEFLTSIKADSYIGFAVFDRKGDVVGMVNAFGKQREFTEPDIKVFQTVGQMVATEFEMLEKEKEEKRMREQLFQAQKMEAIGSLAGGIAHDFNNMLQGILGYASLLKMKLSEDDPIYRPLDVIEHSAERAAELTKQLLGFARKGKYIVEPLNLNDVVDDVLKLITRTFDRTIEIKTTIDSGLWAIEGDRSQIENVILNLCLNARDAMPAGGILHIKTSNIEIMEETKPFAWMKEGKYAVIKVNDTGRGMDEEVKKQIFEPFFTTKEKGKGTGMGLAMVYGVVKSHDGFITVDSELGKGSTFTIYLPAVEKEVKVQAGGAEVRRLPCGEGTILVVDDEKAVRNLARETLNELGYYVLEASDGKEAIEIYEDKKSKIDLVILDLIMPEMGGKETFEKLKKIAPDVKVLVSSGYGIDSNARNMLDDGAKGFIQKPYNINELAEMIKKIVCPHLFI
ncbi:MAG: response regulator [Nitrospirae bacterium]|nr:response regulator [Nitrospirota bacterium]